MLPSITTARLDLRPAQRGDLDALVMLWADVEVRRYLFDDLPVTRARASDVLESALSYTGRGLGLWVARHQKTGDPIGCAGLLPAATAAEYDASLAGAIEPLAAFVPSAWGRGYATESLQALILYAFDALDLEALAAVVDVPNDASHRLVARLGFVSTGECAGPRHRLRTYVLTRDRQRTWEPATR